jgi:gliding motility associated protien GldN
MSLNKLNILIFTTLISANISYTQSNILNAKNPVDIGKKSLSQLELDDESVLEYGYVDDKDILYSKTVWEKIDLNERVNFSFLYPTDTMLVGNERRPLIWHLIQGIQKGKITRMYNDGMFNIETDSASVLKKLNDTIIKPRGKSKMNDFGGERAFALYNNVDLGEYTYVDEDSLRDNNRVLYNSYLKFRKASVLPFLDEGRDYTINQFSYDMVTQYWIKGVWYFDKVHSDLRYRPIAIAPVAKQVASMETDKDLLEDDIEKVPFAWFYYPDIRNVLKNSYVFSLKNSAVRKSYDEIINARMFNGIIYLEENIQGDRQISEYITKNSFMQLIESERIKEKIRNFEHDMWEW